MREKKKGGSSKKRESQETVNENFEIKTVF